MQRFNAPECIRAYLQVNLHAAGVVPLQRPAQDRRPQEVRTSQERLNISQLCNSVVCDSPSRRRARKCWHIARPVSVCSTERSASRRMSFESFRAALRCGFTGCRRRSDRRSPLLPNSGNVR